MGVAAPRKNKRWSRSSQRENRLIVWVFLFANHSAKAAESVDHAPWEGPEMAENFP
jgi:hypothetical protein